MSEKRWQCGFFSSLSPRPKAFWLVHMEGPWGHHSTITSIAPVEDAPPHPPNFVIFLIHPGQPSMAGIASCSTPRQGKPQSTLADGSW